MIRVEVDAPNAGARLDRLVAGRGGRRVAHGRRAAGRGGPRAGRRRGAPPGVPRPAGHDRRGRRARPGARAAGRPTPRCRSPSATRTSTCWWSTSRPASSRTRRRAAATARWCTACWRSRWRAATTRCGPGIVHRLDRDTSGLLVVARNDEAHRALGRLLRRRVIEREYLGLVHGRPPARAGRIEAPIGRDPGHRTRMAVDGVSARPAVTHFVAGGGAARLHAAAPAPGDRPHAPDPRAPRGDRPPRRRRPDLRAGERRAAGPDTPVPARRAPRLPASRARASSSSWRARCRTTSRRRSSWRGRGGRGSRPQRPAVSRAGTRWSQKAGP